MSHSEEVLLVDFWRGHPLSYITTNIEVLRGDLLLSTATGFVMRLAQMYALITNWHVVSGYNPSTGQCLSPTGAIPDKIRFHVAICRTETSEGRTGEHIFFKPIEIDLHNSAGPIWIDDRVAGNQNDYVAIDLINYLPELLVANISLRCIRGGQVTPKMDAPPGQLGPFSADKFQRFFPKVGSGVFVLGYPRGISYAGVFPIWKSGSIASEPEVAVTLGGRPHENLFYIDALTKHGMSGSPVVYIASTDDFMIAEDGTAIPVKKNETFVIGVYAGREGVTQEEYELSLGRVWKIGSVEDMIMDAARKVARTKLRNK